MPLHFAAAKAGRVNVQLRACLPSRLRMAVGNRLRTAFDKQTRFGVGFGGDWLRSIVRDHMTEARCCAQGQPFEVRRRSEPSPVFVVVLISHGHICCFLCFAVCGLRSASDREGPKNNIHFVGGSRERSVPLRTVPLRRRMVTP